MATRGRGGGPSGSPNKPKITPEGNRSSTRVIVTGNVPDGTIFTLLIGTAGHQGDVVPDGGTPLTFDGRTGAASGVYDLSLFGADKTHIKVSTHVGGNYVLSDPVAIPAADAAPAKPKVARVSLSPTTDECVFGDHRFPRTIVTRDADGNINAEAVTLRFTCPVTLRNLSGQVLKRGTKRAEKVSVWQVTPRNGNETILAQFYAPHKECIMTAIHDDSQQEAKAGKMAYQL